MRHAIEAARGVNFATLEIFAICCRVGRPNIHVRPEGLTSVGSSGCWTSRRSICLPGVKLLLRSMLRVSASSASRHTPRLTAHTTHQPTKPSQSSASFASLSLCGHRKRPFRMQSESHVQFPLPSGWKPNLRLIPLHPPIIPPQKKSGPALANRTALTSGWALIHALNST
jgi:hypothetical protein